MAFDQLTQTQLADAFSKGLVNESLNQTVMNANREIPLKLMGAIGQSSHDNTYNEITIDAIDSPEANNALVDGQDIDDNNSTFGFRFGNYTQTSGGRVVVSYEASASDTVGRGIELGYQTSKYSLRSERSQQFRAYANLPSVKGNGQNPGSGGVAAQTAGLEAQIGGEVFIPIGIAGDDGGWTGGGWTGDPGSRLGTADCNVQQVASAGTITGGGINNLTAQNIIPAWTYEVGVFEPGQLTETVLRNAVQSRWNIVGSETTLSGYNRGAVNRMWSEYAFSSTARIATKIDNASEGNRTPREGMGASNIFISDFGVIEFTPENIMPPASTAGTADSDTLFLLDTSYIECSKMWGWKSERQGKTGLNEKWQTTSAWQINVLDPQRQCMVQGIDTSLGMVY